MALDTEEVKHFHTAVHAGNFLKLKIPIVLFLKQNLIFCQSSGKIFNNLLENNIYCICNLKRY